MSTLGSEKAGFDFHCSCAGRRIIRGEAREETSLSDIAQPAARPDSEHALLRTTRCAAVDRMRRPPVATSGLLVGGVDPLLYPNLAYDNRRYHTQDSSPYSRLGCLRCDLGHSAGSLNVSNCNLGETHNSVLDLANTGDEKEHPPWRGDMLVCSRNRSARQLKARVFAYSSVGFLQSEEMAKRRTLRERIEERIARRRDDVFLTREFRDLGGEDQVLRALRGLVQEGRLVRLGYGVYGRAETSRLSGEPLLAARGGFIGAARQALDKLGVQWEPTEFQRAYNEGRSTQVPVNPAVRVKGRFVRRLKYQDTELRLER